MRSFAVLMSMWLSGCTLFHNTRKVVATTQLVAPTTEDELGAFTYIDHRGAEVDYLPEPYKGDTHLVRPMIVDQRGTIIISPQHPDAHLRVFLRNTGINDHGFREIITVTGAREREMVDEVRFLPRPTPIHGRYSLAMADLTNIYNGYHIEHDDVLLLELESHDGVQRAMFQNRRVGWHIGLDGELLLRVPLTSIDGAGGLSLSPAITGGVTAGYRMRNRNSELSRWLDNLDLIVSVGIGTGSLERATSAGDLEAGVGGLLVGVLWGGGLKILDMVSLQALGNPGVLEGDDHAWALAAGVDVWKLRAWSYGAATKLFRKNTLSEPPEGSPAEGDE